ncbi:hypothetical protein HDV00_011236 [Rhizophlyctis rosea]|nr:hypothetical protein HDV00_011236 [Rhizophlyctis rosea]
MNQVAWATTGEDKLEEVCKDLGWEEANATVGTGEDGAMEREEKEGMGTDEEEGSQREEGELGMTEEEVWVMGVDEEEDAPREVKDEGGTDEALGMDEYEEADAGTVEGGQECRSEEGVSMEEGLGMVENEDVGTGRSDVDEGEEERNSQRDWPGGIFGMMYLVHTSWVVNFSRALRPPHLSMNVWK